MFKTNRKDHIYSTLGHFYKAKAKEKNGWSMKKRRKFLLNFKEKKKKPTKSRRKRLITSSKIWDDE
jgi:hypothetical protein